MNEKKRMGIMLGVLLLLFAANLYYRLGGDGIGAGLFSDGTDLEAAYSAKALRNRALLEELPDLSFSIQKGATEDTERDRNPFVFGVDKRREREARARMRELTETRAALEVETVAPVIKEEPAKERFDGEVMGTLQDAETGKYRVSVVYKYDYYTLSVGDVLLKRFKVVDIRENQVRFLSLKDGGETTVKIQTETK